jgi:hypothetical protein
MWVDDDITSAAWQELCSLLPVKLLELRVLPAGPPLNADVELVLAVLLWHQVFAT